MSKLLESYAAGRWYTAPDEGTPLLSAVDGSEVARISATGLDLGEMVTYAREVGGPALAELPFHERAAALKALALHLMTGKDEFYALSAWTGATKRDSLRRHRRRHRHAAHLRQQGPPGTAERDRLVDGAVERLGKTGTFVGQHIYTPRRGVAVQINAFNFPVWGMLEKLAPAFLAGVPSDREARQPVVLPDRARGPAIIESGLLPEGGLQLLSPASARGPARPPGRQDTVAFTGSAATAATAARAPDSSLQKGVRFNAEADSLNCSVLGTDVEPGTRGIRPVRQATRHRDDRQGRPEVHRHPPRPRARRAGGRRHRRRRGAAAARSWSATPAPTASRWARWPAWNSATRSGRSWPRLASRRGRGDRRPGPLRRRRRRPGERARSCRRCCCAPTIPAATEPHDIEVFGPVSTVCGYGSTDHAVDLAARGRGSLVGSLVSADSAGRPRPRAGRRPVPRPGPGPRPRRRAGVHRPRLAAAASSCTAAPAAQAAARNSAASAASCTTCSAPRSRPPPTS